MSLVIAAGCGGSEPASVSHSPAAESTQGGSAQQGYEAPPSSSAPGEQPPGNQPPVQEPGSSGQPPGEPSQARGAAGAGQASSVSQSEVETFAEIQIELAKLQQQLGQQAQQGGTQAELQQLYQQQAVQTVEQSDLSTERFNEIAALLGRDPDLQRRVQTVIEQKLGR